MKTISAVRCSTMLALVLGAGLGCSSSVPPPDAGATNDPSDGGGDDAGPVACSDTNPCSGGLTCCAGLCANVNRDAYNCNPVTCDDTHLCPNGLACCGTMCTDLGRDPQNCGQCGNSCGGSNFCSGTSCLPVTFQNLCADANIAVVLDSSGDQDAGLELSAALTAACAPSMPVQVFSQDADAGMLNPYSGAPMTEAGQMLAAAGGPDVQLLVQYLELGPSPVYYSASSVTGPDQEISFVARNGGATLASATAGELTSSHDLFLLEMVLDPASGTLSFVCYGFTNVGTTAGAWYFAHTVAPQLSTNSNGWMIVEWTAQNGGTSPAPGDTFQVLASGN